MVESVETVCQQQGGSFDALVVGCGFSGAVVARRLAEAGKKVLILEKRPHIGGNMYDSADENGVLVHRYGPHIFHTNNEDVFRFLSRFSDFFPYEHRVLGSIDGRLVPIPFNRRSAALLFGEKQAAAVFLELSAAYPGRTRVTVPELLESRSAAVKRLGEFVFEKVFRNYTAKQWGMAPELVDRSVLGRVPVVLGDDDRYFSDAIQQMPALGYTTLFRAMLTHRNISLALGFNALSRLQADPSAPALLFGGKPLDAPVIWTGPADELFRHVYGALPYRSLSLAVERYDVTHYQPAAVVNYPNEEEFTRITEFKYLTGQTIANATSIMKEYPLPYQPGAARGNIPYYPIASPESAALYARYQALAARFPNLYLCGRLAQYRYYNMDAAVGVALKLSDQVLARM